MDLASKIMKPLPYCYEQTAKLADAIESELRSLNRWSDPLPPQALQNMGAFGQNTMAFEQWIQFILLDRLRSIVSKQGEFPQTSLLATYANRAFDGDSQTDALRDLLLQIDLLVSAVHKEALENKKRQQLERPIAPTISIGQEKLPDVVYTLMDVLHQFDGEDLESQLQTYDTFLAICSPSVRPELSDLFMKAASRSENESSRKRIQEAAQSILQGGCCRTLQPRRGDEEI